ncbi:MAG: glycosyltransferase [Sinimarinibacterium sp.]
MSLNARLTAAKALLSRLSAVKTYLRVHGVRLTLLRILDELVRGRHRGGIVDANRWLDNASAQSPRPPLDPRGLHRPSVAIIGALDLHQCRKYRILQKIEQLDAHGCRAVISSYFDVSRSFDALQLATAVIFYRVPDGSLFQAYVDEARRLGLPIAYDIDDPLFCRTVYTTNANLQTLSSAEREQLVGDCRHYLAAMQRCDAAIVSTPGLVDVASPYLDGKPVYLWRNAIDAETRAICNDVAAASTRGSDGLLRIGYMSGSRAHDLDFQLVAGALARTLGDYPHVQLVVAGHSGIPESLQTFGPRVSTRPFSNYRGYFQTLSEVDIVVIPLLTDPFNACKSAIRFLEAAMMEKPCVISTVGDFLNIVAHGKTGYLAESEADWTASLADLIESEDRRRSVGAAARQDVLTRQTSAAIAELLDPTLLQMIKGGVHV